MTQIIQIYWTSGSLDEARKVSRFLVKERLVACAQITPWIESVFEWNNQLETVQETKVTFKTVRANYDAVKKAIQENCSYQVPEIIFTIVDGGNAEYLDWVEQTQKQVE